MKRVMFMVVLAILAFPVSGMADFLTCDCSQATDNVTGANLQFGTAAAISVPVVTTCGTQADRITCAGTQRVFCYNTSALANGTYTVRGQFVNSTGVSPWSGPFTFAVLSFGAPGTLRLVK